MSIYFIKRNDGYILTNELGLPKVWESSLLCEAMCAQLNSTSEKNDLNYTFEVVISKAI